MGRDSIYTYNVERVFTSWYGALCFFAFRYVQDDEVARDIVQEVFVRLMERKPSFESELHLKNFLYRTVRNGGLNYLRQKLSREHYFEYLRQEGEEEEFECRMIESEIFAALRKAVELLPRECRKVLELCYFEGKDNETAAKILNVSMETVKAQKKRGKKLLRQKLDGLYPLFVLLFGL